MVQSIYWTCTVGTGTIALSLASRCKSVTGVESVTSAVADAKVNARENNITHARFLKGDLAQSSVLTKLGVTPDVVVAGMDSPLPSPECLSPSLMPISYQHFHQQGFSGLTACQCGTCMAAWGGLATGRAYSA